MLAIDVRNHRHRRRQPQERAIALVRFRHHVFAAAEPRVAAERAQPSPDDRRRIQSRPLEHEGDHRGRARLAVRARDRDAEPQPHQLREHLGARNHRDPPRPRLGHLGVVGPYRRGHHHHVGGAHLRRRVSQVHRHAERGQTVGHRRPLRVGSRHGVSQVGEQLGDAAHADPADADEVDAPRLTQHVARPVPSAVEGPTARPDRRCARRHPAAPAGARPRPSAACGRGPTPTR